MSKEDANASKERRVQVVVRVRPVLGNERAEDVAVSCTQDGEKVQVAIPEKISNKAPVSTTNKTEAKSFEFDMCLNGSVNQDEFFDICGMAELTEAALDGFCVTIFAFGQTGSGKTFTMIGPRLSRLKEAAIGEEVQPEDGLVTRCLGSAFEGIRERTESTFKVSATCVEIYNESVTDLFAPDKTKSLHVRADARGAFHVAGIASLACPTSAAACRHVAKAMGHRHTRSHKLNEYSSRSHCIMTFNFESAPAQPGLSPTAEDYAGRKSGKLVLVDLAGSERLKETGNTAKDAIRETGAINRSLFSLGQVLAALCAQSGGVPVHVPYRDSKLTQLLWDGLRGTGRTLMLACLGPLRTQAEETLNTLHFASMALRIKSEPVVILDPMDQLVLNLRNTIRTLKAENQQLAVALQELATVQSAPQTSVGPPMTSEGGALSQPASRIQTGKGPWRETEDEEEELEPVTPSSTPSYQVLQVTTPPPSAPARTPTSPPTPEPTRPSQARSQPTTQHPLASNPQPPPKKGHVTLAPSQIPLPPVSKELRRTNAPAHEDLEPEFDDQLSAKFQMLVELGEELASRTGAQTHITKEIQQILDGHMLRLAAPAASQSPMLEHAQALTSEPESPAESASARSYSTQGSARQRMSEGLQVSIPERPLSGISGRVPDSRGSEPSTAATSTATAYTPQPPRVPAAVGLPPPPSSLSEYPELAALEAQFQAEFMQRSQPPSEASTPQYVESKSEAPTPSAETPDPEPRALQWAQQNKWFGVDREMTEAAYALHDQLVDVEGITPDTVRYYEELDMRLQAAYPRQWVRYLLHPPQAFDGANVLQPSANTASSSPQQSPYISAPQRPAKISGTGFKPRTVYNKGAPAVQPKAREHRTARDDGRETGARSGGGSPSRSRMPATNQKASASAPSSRHSSTLISQQQLLNASMSSNGGGAGGPVRTVQWLRKSNSLVGREEMLGSASPVNSTPPKSRSTSVGRGANSSGGRSSGGGKPKNQKTYGQPSVQAGQQMVDAILQGQYNKLTSEELQHHYIEHRSMVLEELRQAKEDAERERARIMGKINKKLNRNKWG